VADLFVLTGANGSSLNIASYVLADPGPDFGEQDLLKAAYSENPAAEGGVLAFETVNHRTMTFPMRLASSSAFSGALGLQSWLRTLARPGATLDIQLDGVPTAEAVRFDVLTGRYENGVWNTQLYSQTDRLEGTLKLDTQPYGYWPTMILLASSASVGAPGVLTLDTTKLIGDAPGLAELFIAPTTATFYPLTGQVDAAFWSLGARPSFQAWWRAPSAIASSLSGLALPTLLGDPFAPASQTIRYLVASNTGVFGIPSWTNVANWIVPPALEPAYRGRFRAYAWMRLGQAAAGNATMNFYASLDAQSGTTVTQALASSAPIATVPQAAPTGVTGGSYSGASPAFSLVSLGELSLPIVGSYQSEVQFRLWVSPPTTTPAFTATILLDIGGLYLQPLDGAAGVLLRGIIQPTYVSNTNASISGGRFYYSTPESAAVIAGPTSVVGLINPLAPALQHYRGVAPVVGASTIQLDINLAGRQTAGGAPSVAIGQPPIRSGPDFAHVSVRYRPRFAFMKGI
jgi:hypothetical protein